MNRVSYLATRVRPNPSYTGVNIFQRRLTAVANETVQQVKKQTNDAPAARRAYSPNWKVKGATKRQIGMVIFGAWIAACFYLPVFGFKYQQRKAA